MGALTLSASFGNGDRLLLPASGSPWLYPLNPRLLARAVRPAEELRGAVARSSALAGYCRAHPVHLVPRRSFHGPPSA